jgi:hypothetical protein
MMSEPRRHTSPDMRDAILSGLIPAGRWRVGGNCPQQLHIDGPDGATIDIGRVDSPELARYIVQAVNTVHDR